MDIDSVDRIGTSPGAVLITGIPGAGKTTISAGLARCMLRSAHIQCDQLGHMVVAGKEIPFPPADDDPKDLDREWKRQLLLRTRNATLLARSFHAAGFLPIIDDVVVSRRKLDLYHKMLGDIPLVLIVLAPDPLTVLDRDDRRSKRGVGRPWTFMDAELREELTGLGTWLDTSNQTADETVADVVDVVATELSIERRITASDSTSQGVPDRPADGPRTPSAG